MNTWLAEHLGRRPWWMNAVMLFCGYMALVYMPWDFFLKPVAIDEEAWFGFLLHGWWAKLTEPLHWALYGAGAYGLWRMAPWMWPWASLYVGQVALGMLVWNLAYVGGWRGWGGGVVSFLPLAALTLAFWQARERFRRPRPNMRQRYGEWALVTGASAGIGAEFARTLARDGMSCVLTARRQERLQALATELEQQHGVATRVVAADLSSERGAEELLAAVADLEIAVLINNAGIGYSGRFDKQDGQRLRALVQTNCVAPVVIANGLLPAMRTRGRGAMIISGSTAGRQSLPWHAIYAASKAFDLLFGEAVWAEMRGTGVDVLVLEPGPTESEFRDVAGEIRGVGEPAANVVEIALDRLGQQPSVISGWFNFMRANLQRMVPRPVMTMLAGDFILKQTPPEMR